MFKLKFIFVIALALFSIEAGAHKDKTENETLTINKKLEKICTDENGSISLSQKRMVVCRVLDENKINIKYLKENYNNNLNNPSLFIVWDIKNEKPNSLNLEKASDISKQDTVNNIDIYIYYSNITDVADKKVNIIKADDETLNYIKNKTKHIF